MVIKSSWERTPHSIAELTGMSPRMNHTTEYFINYFVGSHFLNLQNSIYWFKDPVPRYPPAEYTWAKAASIQQASSITGCGEKTCVQDYGRRLVIANVEESDYGGYFCQVRNSAGLNSLVLTLEEEPKSYEINFKGITPSYTITPNRYDTFNLTCAVDIISTDAVSYLFLVIFTSIQYLEI